MEAAEDAELDEPFRDHQRRRAVDVVPLRSGTAGDDRGLAGAPDRLVDECLLGGERPADGVRAGDVARVAAMLGARVDEKEVPIAELARRGREGRDGGVVARRDDRLEREEVAAVAEERRLES